jgi:hypothetical protein
MSSHGHGARAGGGRIQVNFTVTDDGAQGQSINK